VAATLYTPKRSVRRLGVQTIEPELAPVVGLHLVQGVHQIVEGIGLQLRSIALPAVEQVGKVVERLLAFAQPADGDVGIQPTKEALVVGIHGAAPVRVAGARAVEELRRGGGVLQVAPAAAIPNVEVSGGDRSLLAEQIRLG